MTVDELRNEYFNWLKDLVCGDRYAQRISFRKLLMRLHSIEFRYSIPMDRNRAEDGINMRYRFALANGYKKSYNTIIELLDGPCSVLEMMVSLAVYCEESIMDDPAIGDRTGQWFWGMIVNLGLGSMTNDNYDRKYVDDVIDRFLDREYEPNGKGGLFTVRHCDCDMRDIEIVYQLYRYLNTIT